MVAGLGLAGQSWRRLSRGSDSRKGVELAAQTLFRADPPDAIARKLAAIAKAFDDVGIDVGG